MAFIIDWISKPLGWLRDAVGLLSPD